MCKVMLMQAWDEMQRVPAVPPQHAPGELRLVAVRGIWPIWGLGDKGERQISGQRRFLQGSVWCFRNEKGDPS